MHPGRSSMSLRGYFSGLAEHAFQVRLGIADPPLIDYVAQLLARFVRSDAIYKVRAPDGRQLGQVAEMLVEAQARVGDARREVHRHIGDFTLFWAGIYPEVLKPKRSSLSADQLIDYHAEGKRAYHIAATMPAEPNHEDDGPLLERLSQQFELCVYGLGEIRKEWERRDDGPERPILIN